MNSVVMRSPVRAAARIAVIYAVVAALWILFSDTLARWLTDDPNVLMWIGLVKGWTFVACTSGLFYVALWRDFSRLERHRHDAEIQAQAHAATNARFRAVVDASPIAISVVDLAGNVEYVNQKFVALLGYTGAEIPTLQVWRERAYPDEKYRHELEQRWHQCVTAATAADREFDYGKLLVTCRDGTSRWLRVKGARVDDRVFLLQEDVTEQHRVEAALRQSEQNYREIFDATTDAIVVLDPVTELVLKANEAVASLFGYTATEALQLRFAALSAGVAPYTATDAQQLLRRAVTDGAQTAEWLCKRKDSDLFWAELTLRRVQLGGTPRVLAVVRDITDRKRAELALRESAAKHRVLFESANDSILLMAGERVIDCNSKTLEIFRCQREQIIGASPAEFSPPTQPDGRNSATAAAEKIAAALRGAPQVFEWTERRPDGTEFDAEVSLTRIELHQKNFLHVIVRDITDRKRAEQQLAEALRYCQTLVETSPVGLITYRASGEAVLVNEAMVKISGGTVAQLKQQNFRQLESWRKAGMVAAADRALATGTEQQLEVHTVSSFGRTLWLAARFVPFQFAGQPHLLALLNDVTDHKRAAADLARRNRQLEQLSGAAQRINTVLDEPVLLRTLVNCALEITGATSSTAGRMRDGRMVFTEYSARGEFRPMALSMAEGEGVTGWVMQARQPYLCNDADHDPRLLPAKRAALQVRNLVAVPIVSRSCDLLGAFEIYNKPDAFDAQDVLMLQGLAASAAVALENTQMLAARREAEDQLRALAASLQSVREEESTRIAREIHDELGQMLTALKLELAWLGQRLDQSADVAARERVESMLELTGSTIHTVRRIATELRPGVLDNLGLVAALEWQAQEFEKRTGIRCTAQLPADELEVEPRRATALFRICQEALTNVARYAAATDVNLRFERRADAWVLEVTDNGVGIEPQAIHHSQSIGLIGMRERAAAVGGEVQIRGQRGRGTTVCARLPVEVTR